MAGARLGRPGQGARGSTLAIYDETPARIVGRDRHCDPVTEDDADAVPAYLAGQLGKHLVAAVGPNAEIATFGNQDDFSLEMD